MGESGREGMKGDGGNGGRRLSPAVEDLLRRFAEGSPKPLSAREWLVESVSTIAFLVVAVAMALLLEVDRSFSWPTAVALVLAYALMLRVKFPIGFGYTVPTQLVFVPMLLLLPPPIVPLLVALGNVIGYLPDYLGGSSHPQRALLSTSNAWHAVGPALVLSLAGPAEPALDHWPIYIAALAAQFAFDLLTSTLRDWLSFGIPPRDQIEPFRWIFLVDLMLSPLGLLAALASIETPGAWLLALPLSGLLLIFSRERQARIDHALELGRAYRGTTLLLSDVLEADDEYTGLHSRDVVSLAVAVADEMGLDAGQRRNVEFGALLHDVGKIAVPSEIINKPGPLTADEWIVIKTHTIEGQRMLDRVGGVLSEVGQVVRSSHERWDGDGYPDGLTGDQIPLEATIVCCCDAFNAMTTNRSYRKARPAEEALEELWRCSGTQFSPDVVVVASRIIERDLELGVTQPLASSAN